MDLSFEHNAFVFHMDIDYVGQGIDAHRLQNYETGIEKYWSDVRTVQIGGYDYPIEFDVNFLDANLLNHATADAQIEINNETCGGNNRSSVTRWCLNQPNEVVTDTQQMQLAAHEFGHLGLGLIDEYDDLLDPGFPLGSQVHLSDQFGNVCHYAGVLGFHLRTGAWCNDMMAVSGGSTKQARYFEQLEGYISGTMDRPGIQFGFAPLQPDIANLPVSTTPLLEDHSIPEPSTILMMFPALALLAWNRKIASRHESRLC